MNRLFAIVGAVTAIASLTMMLPSEVVADCAEPESETVELEFVGMTVDAEAVELDPEPDYLLESLSPSGVAISAPEVDFDSVARFR